jgi:hypothetical protein
MHRKWETKKDDNGREVSSRPTNEGLFIIAKNADGPSGTAIRVIYKGDRMKVYEETRDM